MTHKQIIVDGVDVSECYYYSKGKCLGCYTLDKKGCISLYGICKEINDCHYKQLDQLKAENDELKKIIERLDVPKHEVIDMDIALENEKLKAENEHLSEKEEEAKHYLEEAEKFKNCISEIKEVAKSPSSFKSIFEEPFAEVMKHCPYLNDNVFCTENKTSCVGCICARKQAVYYGEKVAYLEQILQKISGVIPNGD